MIFCGCSVSDRKHQRSNEHRELSLLAYLSQLQSPDPGPVRPLHSLTPYQVHESRDAAHVLLLRVPGFYHYLRRWLMSVLKYEAEAST